MGASTYLLAGQVSELERLRTEAEKPDRWGTTVTLLQGPPDPQAAARSPRHDCPPGELAALLH